MINDLTNDSGRGNQLEDTIFIYIIIGRGQLGFDWESAF